MTALFASLFFLGLGALVEKTGAKFRSDEKALALIRAARQAIGGDSSVSSVQSLRIVGQTTQTSKVDGVESTDQGQTEIALQLPDKLMKTIKIGDGSGDASKIVTQQMDVVVVGGDTRASMTVTDDDDQPNTQGAKTIILKKGDGDVQEINTADGKKVIIHKVEGSDNVQFRVADPNAAPLDPNGKQMFFRTANGDGEPHPYELFRLSLGLLLSTPKGMDVNYTYGGESDVDGTACNLVLADFAGSTIKLFLNRDSNLPVMMAYTAMRSPEMIKFRSKVDAPGDGSKNVMVFKRIGPGGDGASDKAEYQVRFSDYRSVNGVQLPYHWTTNINGALSETFDVTNYEVNPANIADQFQNQKVMIRMKKPDGQ